MGTKAICKSLETGQCYRFLAKKEIGVIEASTSNVCNTSSTNEIELVRCYRSFSATGPIHNFAWKSLLFGPQQSRDLLLAPAFFTLTTAWRAVDQSWDRRAR